MRRCLDYARTCTPSGLAKLQYTTWWYEFSGSGLPTTATAAVVAETVLTSIAPQLLMSCSDAGEMLPQALMSWCAMVANIFGTLASLRTCASNATQAALFGTTRMK